ncbi:MAG: dicarboxylate/amino acid:cation symporter [Oscillospiraceae bacterium]|nr:dicarboxylate/amino acid:cation symporter [Oscillospiraceae bacterium]
MKFFKSLPAKLLLALILGIVGGLVIHNFEATVPVMGSVLSVLASIKYVLNQVIMFCVPLIIIGFIAPSITKLGSSASRMLTVALILAYVSSVLAAFMSMGAGYAIIPNLAIANDAAEAVEPAALFKLDIPQIMPVMSALVLSVLLGLAAVWTKAQTVIRLLDEFRAIVLKIVAKLVIPVLPVYIFTVFTMLAYNGTITEKFPVFVVAIVTVLAGHFVWMAILYGAAGIYTKTNPIEVVKHYGPAYITAVGTMSSAATLSVALTCAHKAKTLRKDMVDFGVPLFANIHLCGSVLTEVFFVMAVSQVLYGHLPSVGSMILFCLLLGVFAIGAPGVPGGTVQASLGLIVAVLGFTEVGTGLMIAIFALQDSFGTACNVTGDGALTLMLTGYAKKHNIAEESVAQVEL